MQMTPSFFPESCKHTLVMAPFVTRQSITSIHSLLLLFTAFSHSHSMWLQCNLVKLWSRDLIRV